VTAPAPDTVAAHAPSCLTVLIVDDEPPARRGLRQMLEGYSDLHVVGEARNGREAIDAIRTLKPAIVFLDVQMPEQDGFDVVRTIGVAQMPVVIFATAFDHYALAAFEAHALDYLLKPYDRARLDAALDHARQQVSHRTVNARLLAFVDRIEGRSRHLQRITVRTGARTQLVPVAHIDYFEAEENYVRLRTGDRSYLIRDTLTGLAERLDPALFTRVHRSLIVQTSRVVEVESLVGGEYVLLLSTGRKLTSGRTYRAAIQAALNL
jgi:two-component system, LytTR family, response regulator